MKVTHWMITEGIATSCKLSWLHSHYADVYLGNYGQSVYLVAFRYEVDGKLYRKTRLLNVPVEPGEKITVEYAMQNPARILAADQLFLWNDPRKWIGLAVGIGLALLIIHLWPNQ